MADRYLLESGAPDGYLLEDSSGVLILEGVAEITGDLAGTLGALAGSLDGSVPRNDGDIDAGLPPLQGRVEQNATSAVQWDRGSRPVFVGRRRKVGAIVLRGAIWDITVDGDMAVTLAPVVAALDGSVERLGDAAVTLPAVVAALDGTVPQPQGDVAVTLGVLAGSLDGTFVPAPITGDLASTLGAVTMAMQDAGGSTGARFFFVEC